MQHFCNETSEVSYYVLHAPVHTAVELLYEQAFQAVGIIKDCCFGIPFINETDVL